MTYKRLRILLFIFALAWSAAGLGVFAPPQGARVDSVLGVSVAQAEPPSGAHLIATTLDGDPDSFAHTPQGDPDAFAQPLLPSDSTSTVVTEPSTRVPTLPRVLLATASAILGILGWS